MITLFILGGCSSIKEKVEKNIVVEAKQWESATINKKDGLSIKKIKGDDKFYYKTPKMEEWEVISKEEAIDYIINVAIGD